MRSTRRKRRLARHRLQAEAVWVALTGAKLCSTCNTFQLSGRMVGTTLYCDECDAKAAFVWPPNGAVAWSASA